MTRHKIVKIEWSKLRCRETSGMIGDDYIYCDAPAVAIVLHYKDQKAYPMCWPDADHNCHNRGGVLIASNQADDHGRHLAVAYGEITS